MSDLAPTEIVSYAVGAGGAGKFLFDFVTARLKKADALESENRAEEAADIKKLLEMTTEMKRDFALLTQTINTQAGEVREVKARVEGISANYGTRLSVLEQSVASIATKIELLLARRRK